MAKPIVAIVGRPNVGKSTLFNKIAGKRISIVEDTPGVTRDRVYIEAEWLNYKFTMIDTGGIEPVSQDTLLLQMKRQAEIAIETADIIVFLVDAQEGVTANDEDVANMLRKSYKKIILACNKVDNQKYRDNVYEFYNLGLGEPIGISAGQGLGIGDLLELIVEGFGQNYGDEYDEDVIKVAVVGKPNAGKSSLINKILGEDRVIVSPIAGTTRDAIDTPFTQGDDRYVFIDTAGMRKRGKITANIEHYSVVRSLTAIERADVCLIMVDAGEGISEQDSKIAGFCHEEGKACIIVVNKWDLVEKDDHTMDEFKKDIKRELPFMDYAPFLFISALTGQRVGKVLDIIKYVNAQASLRIKTGVLNDVLSEAVLSNQPAVSGGRRLKITYMTQVDVKPPTFVLFCNDPGLMHFSYSRYLENQLRKSFGFEGTPINFVLRAKNEAK